MSSKRTLVFSQNEHNDDKLTMPPQGEWETVKHSAVKGVLQNMAKLVGANDSQSEGAVADIQWEELFSVPDVWGKAELFKSNLTDVNSRLHRQDRSRWRGLLALLALWEHLNLDVHLEVVELKEMCADPFDQPSGGGDMDNLAEVLWGMAPVQSLTAQRSLGPWDNVGYILFKGSPVGLLLPSTLVCPAARPCLELDPVEVPWASNGYLRDPLETGSMQQEDWWVLCAYLQGLQDALKGLGAACEVDGGLMDKLRGELGSYLEGVRGKAGAYNQGRLALKGGKLKVGGGFKFLESLGQNYIVADSEPLSDLFLEPRGPLAKYEDSQKRPPRAVLASRALLDGQAGEGPLLWKGVSLARYLDYGEQERYGLEQAMKAAGCALLTEDELFLETLYVLDKGEVVSHAPPLQDILLPLRPNVLCFVEPGRLQDAVSVRETERAGVEVTLTLTVASSRKKAAGSDSKPVTRQVAITRRYIRVDPAMQSSDAAEIKHRVEYVKPPTIGVWPAAEADRLGWQYFASYSPLEQSFTVALPVSDEVMDLAMNRNKPDPLIWMQNWLDLTTDEDYWHNLGVTKRSPIAKTFSKYSVVMADHGPRVMVCLPSAKEDVDVEGIAGLLLLEQKNTSVTNNTRHVVGIDIGSKNTIAYYCLEEDEPKLMRFSGQVSKPVIKEDGEDVSLLHSEFMPPEELSLPIRTIMSISTDVEVQSFYRPLLDAHIYYVPNFAYIINEFEDEDNRLRFDIKWNYGERDDNGDDNSLLLRCLVEQLVMQCMAQLVLGGADKDKIAWRFSYPLAVGERSKVLRDTFAKAVEQATGSETPDVEVISESQAAAEFFRTKHPGAFGGTTITMDVGGSTTDICVWQHLRLLWEGSLSLGGHDILIRHLAGNEALQTELSRPHGARDLREAFADIRDPQRGLSKADQERLLEVLVNSKEYEATFHEAVTGQGGRRLVNDLLMRPQYAVAAMLAYLGRVLRQLKESEAFDSNKAGHITLCLGGRTSLMIKLGFKWTPHVEEILAGILNSYSGMDAKVEIEFSSHPKHEVAFGMVAARRSDLKIDQAARFAVLGEQVVSGDEAFAPDQHVQDIEFTGRETVTEPLELLRFNKLFCDSFACQLPLGQADEAQLTKKVNELMDQYHAELHDNTAGLRPQTPPPFVMEVKQYLHLWSDRMAK